MHHPFTRPKAEDISLFNEKKLPDVCAEAYDVVLNGVEIGGGSIANLRAGIAGQNVRGSRYQP